MKRPFGIPDKGQPVTRQTLLCKGDQTPGHPDRHSRFPGDEPFAVFIEDTGQAHRKIADLSGAAVFGFRYREEVGQRIGPASHVRRCVDALGWVIGHLPGIAMGDSPGIAPDGPDCGIHPLPRCQLRIVDCRKEHIQKTVLSRVLRPGCRVLLTPVGVRNGGQSCTAALFLRDLGRIRVNPPHHRRPPPENRPPDSRCGQPHLPP